MDMVLRAAGAFVLLYLLLRLAGKRELAELTPFEVASLVVLGDMVQQAVVGEDMSLTGAALAVATFTLLSMLLSWAEWRWPALRRPLEGQPQILVFRGRIDRRVLRRERIALDELEVEMRQAGLAALEEVALAVVEPDGTISFVENR